VSDLRSHLGFWLRFVSNHVSQNFARKLEQGEVTVAEWVILREMFHTDTTSPSTLANSTGLTRGAVSKLVDRLVQKKLAHRAEAAEDRRFQEVGLTAAGKVLVPRLAVIADANDEEFFSQLSARERQQLLGMLKKLADAHNLTKISTT
jgi:DNA-binding MarR family transcriptional regulator